MRPTTAIPEEASVADILPAPAAPMEGAPATRRRAPWYLWIAAALVLIPIAVPVATLVVRVIGSGESAWETLTGARTGRLLWNTAALTAAVTLTAAAIGVAAAWLLVRTDIAGKPAWSILVMLPLVIPSYVIALSFLSVFGERGLIGEAVGLGVPAVRGFTGAWLALTLSTYPFVYLVAAASLRRLDPSHEEAARGLGATRWEAFRTIVLPQLRPAVAAGSLLVALYTLSDFGAVALMRFDAFTRVIYAQYQGRLDRTPAAVLALVLVALALAVLWSEQRTRTRAVFFSRRPSRPPRILTLDRRMRMLGTAFLAVLSTLALVIPVAVLGGWLVRGIRSDRGLELDLGAVAGSISGSVMAALLAAAVSIPIAVLTVRHRSRASAWLERAVYAGFALPHITVALAVVFFASRYLGGLYQSLALLVIIYASVFLAQALGSGRAALLQVDPTLEEASRGLGKGTLPTLTRVTVPLMWRGLLAGSVLVFLTTMKELPATLLLRPTGFDTLAINIWSAADDLLYAQAAVPALLLVAVSAIPMTILVRRRET